MSTRMSRPKSAAGSQMSDARRDRLVEIQKREQLKGMLVHKFKLKYGNQSQMSKFIDNEVGRFLANDRLTEGNLKNLDARIGKEAVNRDKKTHILEERRSQRAKSAYGDRKSERSGGLSAANLNQFDQRSNYKADGDVRSRSSRMSKITGVSRGKDAYSVMSSERAPPTEVFSEINENQEWTAIQKFNTLLHYEEQK